MKSHELANHLLKLPNKDLIILKPAGGPYTEEFDGISIPWEDPVGNIRIQICQVDNDVGIRK